MEREAVMQKQTGIIEEISDVEFRDLSRVHEEELKRRMGVIEEIDKKEALKYNPNYAGKVPVRRKFSNREKKRRRIKPNSFCVCGSGKRAKNCCLDYGKDKD